jgi:hypothetical protein
MQRAEIWVEGHLDQQWLEWLGDFTLTHTEQNESILVGDLPDQAALYGLIGKLRDMGLTLISVDFRRCPTESQNENRIADS